MQVENRQDAEKARQQKKTVIWFIWFVSFVWLNQTDQMNQINKTNQFEHPAYGGPPRLAPPKFRHEASRKLRASGSLADEKLGWL